jgi:sugar phosphate permease
MLGYGTGLFINGWIGDKLNPRFFFSAGLIITSFIYLLIFYLGNIGN